MRLYPVVMEDATTTEKKGWKVLQKKVSGSIPQEWNTSEIFRHCLVVCLGGWRDKDRRKNTMLKAGVVAAVLLLSLLAVGAMAQLRANEAHPEAQEEVHRHLFQSFVQKFEKIYGAEEFGRRFGIFKVRLSLSLSLCVCPLVCLCVGGGDLAFVFGALSLSAALFLHSRTHTLKERRMGKMDTVAPLLFLQRVCMHCKAACSVCVRVRVCVCVCVGCGNARILWGCEKCFVVCRTTCLVLFLSLLEFPIIFSRSIVGV